MAAGNPPATTHVPMDQFGRDHWSTLAYLETVAVDHGGRIAFQRMRCDRTRHPHYAHMPLELEGGRYPTRLKGGVERDDHDDWDCLDDLEAAGLVLSIGTGAQPIVKMTPEGLRIAAALRKHRADSGLHARSYDTFEVQHV